MLVLAPSDEVSSVDVSPVPVGGHGGGVENIPGHRSGLNFSVLFKVDLGDSSTPFGGLQEAISGLFLWVRSIDLIIVGVVLLSVSAVMDPWASPGVSSSGPSAVRLNVNVVDTSHNSEESTFTIVRSPRVSDNPVLDSIFDSVADDRDVMYDVHISSRVLKDATSVVF